MSVLGVPRSAVRLHAAALLAAVCVLAGCREKRTVEIPREQPNLLMEILTGLDTGKYASVLP